MLLSPPYFDRNSGRCQQLRAWSRYREVLVNHQLAGSQRDRCRAAGSQRRVKSDRVTRTRGADCITQAAWAAVVRVGDDDPIALAAVPDRECLRQISRRVVVGSPPWDAVIVQEPAPVR